MSTLFSSSPIVLDGGFGTTLKELFQVDISQSPLWCAQPILENPRMIVETHLAFLRAGAQVILTSTYQCSFSTFRRANLSEAVAQSTMLKAVYLADEARTSFRKENLIAGEIKIALSLGPFGSTLSPGQEYDGFYPPPYGPMGFSATEEKTNSFGQDVEREKVSIDALANFHFDRLAMFARDGKAWSAIDIIAFETVPLVREVRAIRKAMSLLQRSLVASGVHSILKPWWVSFVFPKGKCPEVQYPGGPSLMARDVVAAALRGGSDASDTTPVPIPTAVGVNCTPPDLLETLVGEITVAMQDCCPIDQPRPWLVLYPNNGDIYDPISKTWKVEAKDEEHRWEADLAKIVQDLGRNQPESWSGFVVGGCCRTGPTEIRGLGGILRNGRLDL